MINIRVNTAKDFYVCKTDQDSAMDGAENLVSTFCDRTVKQNDVNQAMQDQDKDRIIGGNQSGTIRRVKSCRNKNQRQAEKFYSSDILPKVEKTFICKKDGEHNEALIIGIISVLETETRIDKVLNFLCNHSDTIFKILDRGNAIEFTKVIDILLNTIKNTDITKRQSRQVFSVLNKFYKRLPNVANIQPSLYGKTHVLFSLLLNYNRKDIIQTLTEEMKGCYNKEYFNLYINSGGTIENNYLDLIIKIYSSVEEIQESDIKLFEDLFSFLGANDIIGKAITPAKALHLTRSIIKIVSSFDEYHQGIFIKDFLYEKIDDNNFDEMLLQDLEQNKLLTKYNCIIKKQDVSKISEYKTIDYLADQEHEIFTSTKIDNNWLLETATNDGEKQILSMIEKLGVYNIHILTDYLLSTHDIVFKAVIASKSSKLYKHMTNLLIATLQGSTNVSEEDANKAFELLNRLYVTLPSLDSQSISLCIQIYQAFDLLIPECISLIRNTLQQATNINPSFYFPLSIVIRSKKIIDAFLDLVVKISNHSAGNYKLLDDLFAYIRRTASTNSPDYKLLFLTEKLYKVIIDLPDEKRSMVIKSFLDDPKLLIDIKDYLYVLFNTANINIPDCKFKLLDQSSMRFTEQNMELIKIRYPRIFPIRNSE